MDLGVKIPNLSPLASRRSILEVGRRAEALGFAAVWASDHLVFAESTVHQAVGRRFPVSFETPVLDPLVALSVVAGATERIRLGTSVLVLANRNPVAIAKAWASLDHLAPGRVIAGIGTGWQEAEFRALGAGDRFRRRGSVTEEYIEILRRCWTDDRPSFSGRFYELEPLHFHPRPAAPIPILLGGTSDRGLARVGRVGDGFHGTNLTPERARETIDRIRQIASEAGRDPVGLVFTTLCELDLRATRADPEDHAGVHLVGPEDVVAERLAAFEAAGIGHLALRVRALSGSTRPEVQPAVSLSAGLEQLDAVAALVGSVAPAG